VSGQPHARITLVQGDITEQRVDAVVNAANSSLLGGAGVDGAIHRVGGPEVLTACQRLRAERLPAGLPPGQAVATPAGKLPARWVIHTVGPVYHPDQDRSPLLASCYRESLRLGVELGARTIAFPAISAGAYRWPTAAAARIALEVTHAYAAPLAEVRFVLFSERVYRVFEQTLADIGVSRESDGTGSG
jgi:O-acetyl-ADP-ribose deacetylase (regulator of RNase III)